jgi:hypothetical protein
MKQGEQTDPKSTALVDSVPSTRLEGWGYPDEIAERHGCSCYFVNGRSLCGKWRQHLVGLTAQDSPVPELPTYNQCESCYRRVRARLQPLLVSGIKTGDGERE